MHDGNKKTAILEPQKDPIGLYTLGWGARYDINIKPVTADTKPITLEEAEELFIRDLKTREQTILKYVKVDLNQNQFNALASLIYNIGVRNFIKSTLLLKLNQKVKIEEKYFTDWCKARVNGKLVVLPGLLARRKEEYYLFNRVE